MEEKKVTLGQFGTIPVRWGSDGSAGNQMENLVAKDKSQDFVVGQDMAGITQELFPKLGIHP